MFFWEGYLLFINLWNAYPTILKDWTEFGHTNAVYGLVLHSKIYSLFFSDFYMENVRTLLEKHLTEDKDILEVIVYICFIMFMKKKNWMITCFHKKLYFICRNCLLFIKMLKNMWLPFIFITAALFYAIFSYFPMSLFTKR